MGCCWSGQSNKYGSGATPDETTRRQTAAEAAERRAQQMKTRGIDEDEFRRMESRNAARKLQEEQVAQLEKQNSNSRGGLRWQVD